MSSPNYTDVEQQEPTQQRQNEEQHDDEEDFKKMAHYHEMAQVHRLTKKVYFQCLLLMVVIGVLLSQYLFSQASKRNMTNTSNNIMTVVCIILFILLSFFASMCGSENAQTKLLLIILMSIFLGLSTGFFVAMNLNITSKYSKTYRYYNDPS